MQWLRTGAWLICGIYATIPIYWLMVHPFARQWRGRRYRLRLLAPLWGLTWCVAWAVSYPWSQRLLYVRPVSWVAALPLWAVSVFMYFHSGRELSLMRVIGRDEVEPNSRPPVLVTCGVHRLVRHPMYLGHICTMLGLALGAGTMACFSLLAFALAAGAIMLHYEERELHERFGEAWEEYCAQTPAIFPRPRN